MNAQRNRDVVAIAAPPQRQTVLWVIAVLLAIIATALVMRSPSQWGLRPAYGDTPMVGARGIFAFTGQLDKYTHGLFMMDVDTSNIWCYQYVPGKRKLKLVAARSFLYDRYLEDYDNEEPTPQQVKSMLADQRKIKDRISRGDSSQNDLNDALETGAFPLSTKLVETSRPRDKQR